MVRVGVPLRRPDAAKTLYACRVEVRRTAPGQSWFAEDDLVLVHCSTLVREVTVRELVAYSARRTGPPKLAIIYAFEGSILGVPDEACRAAFVELSRHGERIYSSVALVTPSGFSSAIARAFVSSVRLMSRAKLPLVLTSDVVEAIAWSRRHAVTPSVIPSTPVVMRALEKMRS